MACEMEYHTHPLPRIYRMPGVQSSFHPHCSPVRIHRPQNWQKLGGRAEKTQVIGPMLHRSSQKREDCQTGWLQNLLLKSPLVACGSLNWAYRKKKPSNGKQGKWWWVDILKNRAGYISASTIVLKSKHEGDFRDECSWDCKFIWFNLGAQEYRWLHNL